MSYQTKSDDLHSLSGLTIVNTRPKKQALALSQILKNAGARVIEQPVIEITDITDTLDDDDWKSRLLQVDIIIFISANAVEYFLQWYVSQSGARQNNNTNDTPPKEEKDFGLFSGNMRIATVGKATAKGLQSQSEQLLGEAIFADIVPDQGNDSESLLKHPAFKNCTNKNILIVRGQGGREYLAEQLRHRGARVDYMEVYQRSMASLTRVGEEIELLELIGNKQVDFIVITSSEGLSNLLSLVGQALQPVANKVSHEYHLQALAFIAVCKILVVHPKIAEKARDLGLRQEIIVAEKANNEAIFEALVRYSK